MPRKALTNEFEQFVRHAYHMSGSTLLDKVEKGESGGRGNAVSKAGARGWMQFMPATRQAVLNYTGGKVDPWRSEGEARQAAELHLLGKLGNRRGLGGYNPGDPSYPSYILHQQVSGGGSSSAPPLPGSRTQTTSRTIPGVDRSQERKALILQFLQQRGRPGAVTSLATGLDANKDTPSRTVKTTRVVKGQSSSSPNGHGGTATFDGKPVASWIKPLLQYARERGWKGTVTSGVRTDAEQTRIYQSGVRPAAVPKSLGGAGSNHERTGFLQGAVDVSDAATLDRILRAKHSRLKFAGARDPVHFSVPRNGSY